MKRYISLLLTVVMVISLAAITPAYNASAADSVSGSDALAALGIDTSAAPEGFDPNDSESNPYGRKTIAVTPVFELYTVGLNKAVSYSDGIKLDDSTEPNNGSNIVVKSNTTATDVQFKSYLYGDQAWSAKTTAAILGSSKEKTLLSKGTTTSEGSYAQISTGTYNSAVAKHPTKGYLTGAENASTRFSDGTSYAMSSVSAGKFNAEKDTLKSQIAMVYTGSYSKNGGLYLRFGDAVSGSYGTPLELLSTSKEIGNPTLKNEADERTLAENFAENPYQLKNYLHVATGDWNGDGVDEVAVYIPEVGNSRIVVYALQTTASDSNDAYKNPSKWGVAWTYYLREGSVVSNMVSLVSGDVDQDGIDDLACTWGYYYGPNQNVGSRAVVMFGGKGTDILKRSQEFSLNYGSSNIIRASFVFGDLSGSGEECLILCGQSDADLKSGNENTRYVAMYSWDGKQFNANSIYQNFDLFSKKDDAYVWSAMGDKVRTGKAVDRFYSLPLCVANTAIITRPLSEDGGDLLYFDSLIIAYTDKGLTIEESWDNTKATPGGSDKDYVEYEASAGALTGDDAAGTLFTMTQTMSTTAEKTASYIMTGSHEEPQFTRDYYYKNWFCKLFKKKTYYWRFTGYKTVDDTKEVNVGYRGYVAGDTYITTADRSENYLNLKKVDSSYALCLANTDNDSSYMNYTGKHYYTYTDPKVLAVLASPPYFGDLLERDDLSGNYPESTTTYASSTGSGSGSTGSTTITAGAYVSYEQDLKVFGVTIASIEAEATVTAGFTWETEKTSTLEQTITYSATSGEDKVAFYSIPMEIYEYESYVPNGKGGYDKVVTTVNIPHEASVRLLNLDDYEAIAKDYSILPTISDGVLTHTLGDPSTYPSDTKGHKVIAEYSGTPAKVGFTSAGGGSTITQEIAMSSEKSNAYIGTASIEAKAGAGAGGVKVGVVAGFEGGGGTVTVSTSGSSFSGELQDMPSEAEAYGYSMNWRIFCYEYKDRNMSFPVVSYVVTDVAKPAPLPKNFEQNMSETTSEAVTLTWTYDRPVSGFQIYRYYDFPEGSGSYRLKYVPFSAGKLNSDGTYSFSYTDEGLSPYTEYFYQIQTQSAYKPYTSIYSEPLSCRTKTEVGYPDIKIAGLNEDGNLAIYPDAKGVAVAEVAEADKYKGLSYQWQRLNGGDWSDISGAKTNSYTILNASSADNGAYRCRVNAIYFDNTSQKEFNISAYSDAFTTAYSKRTPSSALTVSANTKQVGLSSVKSIHAEVKMHSADKGSATAPTGTVTFTISGTDYEYSETVALADSGSKTEVFDGESKHYSTATLDVSGLSDGAYTVNTYYSGDRVFKDYQTTIGEMAVIGTSTTGYRLTLSKSNDGHSITKFTYGDLIYPTLKSISGTSEGYQDETEGVTFQIAQGTASNALNAGDAAPSAGAFTVKALKNNKVVAEVPITVEPREVLIRAESKDNISANAVASNPPEISGENLTEAELSALKLTWTAVNSAGNKTELADGALPGNYTVTPCKSADTPDELYNNYNITFVSGIYTIIGQTFRLTVDAQKFTDGAGPRPVGTAGISSTGKSYDDYSKGTMVQLYAQPNDGYMVDHWTVQFGDEEPEERSGESGNPNILNIETQASTTTIKVYFKVKPLILQAYTDFGGEVICGDEYFTTGANVTSGAEYTFTAKPKDGYHFVEWQLGVEGTSTIYPEGKDNGDGTNTIDVSVGTNSITLKAVFARDSYKVNLRGDIVVYYLRQNPSDPTSKVKVFVTSGKSVEGDTKLIAEPKVGYLAAENANYMFNGSDTGISGTEKYEFTLLEDSTISLETQRDSFDVETRTENGKIIVSVDGKETEELSGINGGSTVVFTARADRGYRFGHWEVDGNVDSESGDVLTVAELGGKMTVKAVFEENTEHTAKGAVSPDNRGVMCYTLYDIYGEVVGEEETEIPAEGLTVYEGESILFKAKPISGYMVEQWVLDNKNVLGNSKTYPDGKIEVKSKDIDVLAYLVASSNYEISFIEGNSNGKIEATADGNEIVSQSSVPGGSDIVLTATPDSGYMVDYWTVSYCKLGDTENTDAYEVDGIKFVNPVLNVEGLRNHAVYRVFFKEIETNEVSVSENGGGSIGITYVTPIKPSDDGSRANVLSENVRADGEVVLELTPEANYATTESIIRKALSNEANSDADIEVSVKDGVYTARVRNLTQGISLKASDLFYRTYAISVPDDVTSSHARAGARDVVKLTVKPSANFATSEEVLKNAIASKVNSDAIIDVSSDNGVYTVTIRGLGQDVAFDHEELFYETFAVNVCENVKSSHIRAKEGEAVKLTVTPAEKYNLRKLSVSGATLNEQVSSDRLEYTFAMPASDVTVTAEFTYRGGGGGGGGGGGAAPNPTPATPMEDENDILKLNGEKISGEIKISNDSLSINLNNDSFKNLKFMDNSILNIDITDKKNIGTLIINNLSPSLINNKSLILDVKFNLINVKLDANIINNMANTSGENGKLTLKINDIMRSELTDKQSNSVPRISKIMDISIISADKNGTDINIHSLGGIAEIEIPYTLKGNEKAENLVVHYLTDDGKLETVGCRYDAERKIVIFKTNHFSKFVVMNEYSKQFSDVSSSDWFYSSVNNALESGWFNGLSATKFAPSASMTRAMLVQVLYRMSGAKAPANKSAFSDVSANAWYADAVAWASENGIVKGYSNGKFGADDVVTRQQMAAILYRYDTFAGNAPKSESKLGTYKDAKEVQSWAYDAMSWANAEGLINGTSASTLSPNGNASRAQVATILSRYAYSEK